MINKYKKCLSIISLHWSCGGYFIFFFWYVLYQ